MANKNLKLCGDIPSARLYRFFSLRDYAEQFASGNFRFGWQKKYSSMEGNIREDMTEGTASFTVNGNAPGEIFESGSFGSWECYILCTSQVDCASELRTLSERFSHPEDKAGYFVEIQDLHRFTEDAAKALKNSPYWDAVDYIFWKKVKYNKFENIGGEPPDVEFHSFQKPAKISTLTYKNKETGKTVTLSSSHMLLMGQGELSEESWSSAEWDKTQIVNDFTVENEWRLIVSIKPRFKVEQANIPMFVTGSERDKRICRHMGISRNQIANFSATEIDQLVPATSYWIDTIEVNNKMEFGKYLCVDEIRLNR